MYFTSQQQVCIKRNLLTKISHIVLMFLFFSDCSLCFLSLWI